MLANATALPTLSQVQSMDTAYLPEAADYWERTGNLWDDAFTTIHERMSTPGGVPWKGLAAKQEWQRSYTDMMKVRPVVSQLHEAAGIARRGDEALQALRAEALLAVCDARADGFDVGEDYSVTDRSTGNSAEFRAARLTAAQAHSTFIRHRVAALVAKDYEITTQIAETTAGVDNLTFVEASGADSPVNDKHNGVELVDNKTWRQDPPPTPHLGPSADDIRRVLDKLPRGNQPWIREVRSPEDLQNLWNWMAQNGVDNPNRYGDPAKGEWKDLPDGTGVGQRYAAGSTKQRALDVRVPGEDGYIKVHINPRGGVPDIPAPGRPAPPEAPPARAPVDPPPVARPEPASPPAAPPVKPAPVEPPRPVEPPAPRPGPSRPGFGGFGGGGIGGGGGGPLPGQHGGVWEPIE